MVHEVLQKMDPRTTGTVIRLVMNSHLLGMIGNLGFNPNRNQDHNLIGTIVISIINILIVTTEKEIGVKWVLEIINVIMENLVIVIIVVTVLAMIDMTPVAIITIDMKTVAIIIIRSNRKNATNRANLVSIVAVTHH